MSAIETADRVHAMLFTNGMSSATTEGLSVVHDGVGEWTITLTEPVNPARQVWLLSVHGSNAAFMSLEIVDESIVVAHRASAGAPSDGQFAAVLLELPNLPETP